MIEGMVIMSYMAIGTHMNYGIFRSSNKTFGYRRWLTREKKQAVLFHHYRSLQN